MAFNGDTFREVYNDDLSTTLVIITREGVEKPLVVAIALDYSNAISALHEQFGIPKPKLYDEFRQITPNGRNGEIYFDVVAPESPGLQVFWGIRDLIHVGYDVEQLLDSYFEI